MLRSEAVLFRGYQANLARIAAKEDTLVVLPTGMGKTVVALLVLADVLRDGKGPVLILAPTRPLVEQHGRFLRTMLAPPWDERVHVLTGNTPAKKRAEAYGQEGVLVATPQVVQNDAAAGRVRLGQYPWIVYDEAHRAVGDYPYTALGALARQAGCRALGLTASPGHDVTRINEVREHLGLGHVEIRTPLDSDVAEYVQPMRIDWETLPLPPALARVSQRLQEALKERIQAIRNLGYLKGAPSRPGRYDLLELQRTLQAALRKSPDPDSALYSALSLQAQAMKILHAIEQAETQGAAAFLQYMENVRGEAAGSRPSKASRAVAEDPRLNEAYHIARLDTADNPKMGRTATLVQEQLEKDPESLVIVFTHYRATCENVAQELAKHEGVRPVVFVGQGKRAGLEGMTQKQQAETVARFTAGEHNVLVATSVAEEGLDIPETDLVIFYEPVPSEIRAIQRRGRTGRKREGRAVVLITKGTQDEAAHWTARRKEQQMVQQLQALRATLQGKPLDGQTRLGAPPPSTSAAAALAGPGVRPDGAPTKSPAITPRDATAAPTGPRIVCDNRETPSGVPRHLQTLGARVESRALEVGDFVLSDRVVVERKTTKDFVDSLLDGRLFEQLRALRVYPRPVLVLEGDSLYGHRQVGADALLGALSSIGVDYQVPVFRTTDAQETARLLAATAKREQNREGRRIAIRSAGRTFTDEERRLYILCGLPGISDRLAARLLDHFQSVAAVLSATEEELAQVADIGPKRAADIRTVLEMHGPAKLPRAETV